MNTAASREHAPAAAIDPSRAEQIIASARGLQSLIESEADTAEREGSVPLKVIDALRQEKLFWILCPTELGGSGQSILTYMSALEQVSRADASVGWTMMANSTATLAAAIHCTDVQVERMFGGREPPIMALAYAPSGQCVEEDGHYRGGGRFGFGSGIAHADWVSGGLVVKKDGKPVLLPSGMPRVLGAFVPRANVELRGNWNVTGLQGTGSYDFEIVEQAIPREATYSQYFDEPKRGGPVSALGTFCCAAAGHAAVVLGIARRALEEVASNATRRKRLRSTETISTCPVFRSDFARHEALFQATRALVHKAYQDAEARARSGQDPSESESARMRQAVTWAHVAARDIVMFSFAGGASASLRNPSVIGRCLRDVTVAAQHIIADPSTMVDAAPPIIADWAAASSAGSR